MRLYRIGDKVVSRDKLLNAVDAILEDRERGATQEQAARHADVQRSFVSFLETLGEMRRGTRVALVAFPVANGDEVQALAEAKGLDFVLVVSQAERELIECGDATQVFNQLLETLAALRDFDTLVFIGSDERVRTVERLLGAEVVGISLGPSPLRESQHVDVSMLGEVLDAVLSASVSRRRTGRVGHALREAAELAGRWTQSRK